MALARAVTMDDVTAAAGRLAGIARRTPVLRSSYVDALVGAAVHFKCESFQRAGAFKFRGAYNALARWSESGGGRGVVTHSSGNHAQALALAARLLGVRAMIVMPTDAPEIKLAATRGYLEGTGGEIVAYDRESERREDVSARLTREHGLDLIPPYDHPDVIAGQGTAALELIEEVGGLDLVLAPCGGGGLLSGCAIAVKALSPGARVTGVEPEAGDDGVRSFRSRSYVEIPVPRTIADGARTTSLGRYTLPIILGHVDDMMAVTDAEIVRAMRVLWERMKLVVEPTGALALAGLFRLAAAGGVGADSVGVIISGGNVDLSAACELFRRDRQGSTGRV
jgi:threonine dehydratase